MPADKWRAIFSSRGTASGVCSRRTCGARAPFTRSKYSCARRAQHFGNDTLAYFTERLAASPTGTALARLTHGAKRRKAFGDVWLTVGRRPTVRFPWCHLAIGPRQEAKGPLIPEEPVTGQQHKRSLLAAVDGELVLPADVEPDGPRHSEQGASPRLLNRSVAALGRRFPQYVGADSGSNAPTLHAVGDWGLHAVVRLEANLLTLYASAGACARSEGTALALTVEERGARVELCDADDFEPREDLRWPPVRVLRPRQHRHDGSAIGACWLTDFSPRRVRPLTHYRLDKGQWTNENQGFNHAKARGSLDNVPHHEANRSLISWLPVLLTLTPERLCRLRWLHADPARPSPPSPGTPFPSRARVARR